MTARRLNLLQDLLRAAGEDRAFAALIESVETREAIRPIERRRQHRLAALVAMTPACRRAA